MLEQMNIDVLYMRLVEKLDKNNNIIVARTSVDSNKSLSRVQTCQEHTVGISRGV